MGISDRLRNNLPLKLLSLAIALVIWGAVHNQADPLVVRRRAVPVEALGVPPNLAVAAIEPPQVTVTLFGRSSAFDQLEYGDFRLTVAVSRAEVGTQMVVVEPEGLPAGLQIRDLSRKIVRVDLDALVSEKRAVFVETRGEPASGFAAAKSDVKPGEVTVTGPSSQVQRVARVVAQVDISGRKAALTTTLNLSAQDAGSLEIPAVRLEPTQATVVIQLQQVSSRTVPAVPVPLRRGDETAKPEVQPAQPAPPAPSVTPAPGVAPPVPPDTPPPPPGHKEPATGSQQAPPVHNQPGTAPTDAPRSGARTRPGPVEPPKPAPAQ